MKKRFGLFALVFLIYYSGFSQVQTDSTLNLFFNTNSAELDSQQFKSLTNFTQAYPIITRITGYADTTGTAVYNLALSKKRAFAVLNGIKNLIALPDRNTVIYFGESSAFATHLMNRRVEIQAAKMPVTNLGKSQWQHTNDSATEFSLDNIYFVPDQPVLLQESVPYIQQLATQLNALQSGIVEIVGHVNYQSQLDSTHLQDLYKLSRLRAKAVFDLLVDFGIPASRMAYKGVGNSQPLFSSPINEAEKRKNMRVQIRIR